MFSAWRRVDRNARRVAKNHGFDGDWRLESLLTMTTFIGLRRRLRVVHSRAVQCHLGWRNRRRLCLQKGGRKEHISLITIMFCFNEFAFTVQVKHKIKIVHKFLALFGYVCILRLTGHFHSTYVYFERM